MKGFEEGGLNMRGLEIISCTQWFGQKGGLGERGEGPAMVLPFVSTDKAIVDLGSGTPLSKLS